MPGIRAVRGGKTIATMASGGAGLHRKNAMRLPPAAQEDLDSGPDTVIGADAAVRLLRKPATIRARCASIAAAVASGNSPHFTIDRAQLGAVAERVARLSRTRYPGLEVPFHSRWRHFEAGGIDRKDELDRRMEGRSAAELTRARIDLTVVSALLDAGAGPPWRYVEPFSVDLTGTRYARSEGLAVASFRAFVEGRFSSDPDDPCRVDAQALIELDTEAVAAVFKASQQNPLVGLDGRTQLLQRLGKALLAQPRWFGPEGRPGMMLDALVGDAPSRTVAASRVLGLLLDAFSGIWPSGQSLKGRAIGDVWPHPHAGGQGIGAGLVPFHGLSQWLTYSLADPFEWAGATMDGLEELTGLPDHRNGGLLLDAGVLVPRDARRMKRPMSPAHPWIVEWRALTIALLDELAPRVREILHVDATVLPLAAILQGGTWAAGRAIAAERRPGGASPVAVKSDGTVF